MDMEMGHRNSWRRAESFDDGEEESETWCEWLLGRQRKEVLSSEF